MYLRTSTGDQKLLHVFCNNLDKEAKQTNADKDQSGPYGVRFSPISIFKIQVRRLEMYSKCINAAKIRDD